MSKCYVSYLHKTTHLIHWIWAECDGSDHSLLALSLKKSVIIDVLLILLPHTDSDMKHVINKWNYPYPEKPDPHVSDSGHGCEDYVHCNDRNQNIIQWEYLRRKFKNTRWMLCLLKQFATLTSIIKLEQTKACNVLNCVNSFKILIHNEYKFRFWYLIERIIYQMDHAYHTWDFVRK